MELLRLWLRNGSWPRACGGVRAVGAAVHRESGGKFNDVIDTALAGSIASGGVDVCRGRLGR